jgi:hypothetical protein
MDYCLVMPGAHRVASKEEASSRHKAQADKAGHDLDCRAVGHWRLVSSSSAWSESRRTTGHKDRGKAAVTFLRKRKQRSLRDVISAKEQLK